MSGGKRHGARPQHKSAKVTAVVRGVEGCPRPDKTGYPDRAAAKRVYRQFPVSGSHVYLCECGYFHIGSRRPGTTREQARENAAAAHYVKEEQGQ